MEWGGGQWSNENILQMLEQYKQEPCLWDPRTRNYKNHSAHAFAWKRILAKLPFKTTVDEAKKKKNSLMGYYRIHLNRYKKTLSITGGRGVYQTTWFAFELMHSFLRPIYGPKKKKPAIAMSPASTKGETDKFIDVKLEPRSASELSENPEEMYIDEYKEEFPLDINEDLIVDEELSTTKPSSYPIVSVNEGDPIITVENSLGVDDDLPVTNKPEKENLNTPINKEKKEKAKGDCDCGNKEVNKREKQDKLDEYDHFGFMLASKIRKIENTPEREILMNSIQNLVFETYMKSRKKNKEKS